MHAIQPPLTPRKAPRQARSRALVEAIVEATARIFEREGAAACTTNAVAETAGVSIGSLYQYFPNRHALTAALVAREHLSLLTAMQNAATRQNPAARLTGMVDVAVDYEFSRPALARTLDLQEAAPEFLADQQETLAALHACVASALELSDTAAWDVIALAQGMIAMAVARGEDDPASLKRRIHRAAFGYLGWPVPD
ncbi:TetR/AcrR family transcriptional regulator [Cronobacter malonaticus]|uniref:TetR/AcrR family transcriptional regulator n=1 Tax=Cronobacter malonaticus TaxID=413503 RepID=UPI0005189038|nr:TetR/AcrR family transcriptional regulator [Cronobacter malonaticus]EGT4385527.1 TetR/AcrR family transcriptional regulator [Cronobacter malonaticus]EGT4422912.1 TetR/AcrR family transcriptional regulator [Cronobacter malonaticus]EGT4456015.1 TetR/AcrR family transcriptional regulator [Cronobacter malonaticus]EKP4391585.1 TetR/AcrR family transcriptional regulator [Cronobacter malonaticus]ELY2515244.1 TetR/AcrR family transcriptional regulator [Cronobacter malonaticus]